MVQILMLINKIVTLNKKGDNGGLVLTCSRSILQAGEEFVLKPA